MSTKSQQACALCGYAMIALFLIGFLLSGFITPPSPNDSAQKITQMFAEHRTSIRIGLIISMFAATLLTPWAVSLFMQLRRAAGPRSPWPYLMVLLMAIFSFEFVYLVMFWQVAAFRDALSPDIVRMLNDMGWIPFVGITATAVVGAVALSCGMLTDPRQTPVFPRWLGYFNLWAATLFTPGTFCVFFKSGPLAYDGLLAWYLPVTVFTIWMVTNTIMLQRAVRTEQEEILASGAEMNGDSPMELQALARDVALLRAELQARPVEAS